MESKQDFMVRRDLQVQRFKDGLEALAVGALESPDQFIERRVAIYKKTAHS